MHHLPSGAGHDGMALIDIAPIGMLFVRCKGGISHNPAEAVTLDDVAAGARVFLRFIARVHAAAPMSDAMPRPTTAARSTTSSRRIAATQTRFLAELVKVPSDNPPGDCAPHAARAAELLEALGFTVERHVVPEDRGRGQRHGQLHQPRRARALRRSARAGDRAQRARRRRAAGLGWTDDPYGAEVRDGVMYGRGVAVSKSDFATYAFALLALRDAAARGAAIRRHGRTALHLRRGSWRRASVRRGCCNRRSARPTSRSRRASPTASPRRTTAACISRSRSSASPVTRREPEKGIDALEAATGILADLYALRKIVCASANRRSPASASPTLVVGLITGGINTNVVPDRVTLPHRSPDHSGRESRRRRSDADAADPRVRARSGRASR